MAKKWKYGGSMPVQAQTGYDPLKQTLFDRYKEITTPTTPTMPTFGKPMQFQTRQEYENSLLGKTVPIGLANVIEGAASGATFGATDKLLGRGAGQMIPTSEQTMGERGAFLGGQIAGSLVPGIGMYSAASRAIPKATTVGGNIAREAGLGALTGGGYQTVVETLDAMQGGTASAKERAKNIALASVFGGLLSGAVPAVPALAQTARRVMTTPATGTTLSSGGVGTGQRFYDAFMDTLTQQADTGASGGGGKPPKPPKPTTPRETTPEEYTQLVRNFSQTYTNDDALIESIKKLNLTPDESFSIFNAVKNVRTATPVPLQYATVPRSVIENMPPPEPLLYDQPQPNKFRDLGVVYDQPQPRTPRPQPTPRPPIEPGQLNVTIPALPLERAYPESMPFVTNPNARVYTRPQTQPTGELPYTVVNPQEAVMFEDPLTAPQIAKEEQILRSIPGPRTPSLTSRIANVSPTQALGVLAGLSLPGAGYNVFRTMQEQQTYQTYLQEIMSNPTLYPQFFNADGTVNEELLRQAIQEIEGQ